MVGDRVRLRVRIRVSPNPNPSPSSSPSPHLNPTPNPHLAQNGVSGAMHARLLASAGWSEEEYRDGLQRGRGEGEASPAAHPD